MSTNPDPMKECRHFLVEARVFLEGEHEGEVALWNCEDCRLRFYPACRVCIDVGHRSVEHPASEEAPHGR